MSKDQAELSLAEALEDYHRHRARGERPDEAVYREELGDLYPEFLELVAAETLIDRAIEPAGEESVLPLAWGAYTLLREIARGAAGVVYEAVHRKLGRKVALKVLRTGVDTDETARERFQREAQALAQIKHDHIVEIYEYGDVDGRPYYAMTLIEGPTLADLVKVDQRPAPADACRGLAGIADAMITLHEAGIIHRDIKPSNIMIDKDGRYMLADFGLARSAMSTTMTRSGDALGTPLYMSPEQILGNRKAIEARTDIYGLGATLYQVLTGAPPFKTDSLQSLMRMILRERPTHPRQLDPSLPAGSGQIAMMCLEKEPRDRYANARALRADLLACADGARVSGKPVSRVRRGLRLVRKNPTWAAAAVLLALLGTWFLLREPPVPLTLRITPMAQVKVEGYDSSYRAAAEVVEIDAKANRNYGIHVKSPDKANFEDRFFNVKTSDVGLEKRLWLIPKTAEGMTIITRAILDRPDAAFTEMEQHRGGNQPANEVLEPLYPRGNVRREDALQWAVFVGVLFDEEEDAWLCFYADGALLHEELFSVPPYNFQRGDLPARVKAALKPGVVITWGLSEGEGKKPLDTMATSFTIVTAESATKGLADLDAMLKAPLDASLPEWGAKDAEIVRATLRAEIFLRHDLPSAAWAELQPLINRDLDATEEDNLMKLKPGKSYTSTPYILALKREALLALMPKSTVRDESMAWANLMDPERNRHSSAAWARFHEKYGK